MTTPHRFYGLAATAAIATAAIASPAIATEMTPAAEATAPDATMAEVLAPTALDHFEASAAATSADALAPTNTPWQQATLRLDAAPTDGPEARRFEVAQGPYRNSSGRRNSAKFSYTGIGGAIGITDDDDETNLGEGGFSILGKTGLSERFSIHSASVLGDNSVSTFALTADFPIYTEGSVEERSVSLVPFVGAGIALNNLFKDDSQVGFVLTGGVDVPIAYRLTATGRIVSAFFGDSTDVGIALGIGYTYTGFFK
ncbi:MAG: hypothetical protein Fur0042_14890 [Cyanophyceae cyanobacterium]